MEDMIYQLPEKPKTFVRQVEQNSTKEIEMVPGRRMVLDKKFTIHQKTTSSTPTRVFMIPRHVTERLNPNGF